MAAETKKYLDELGVKALWKSIKDETNTKTTNTIYDPTDQTIKILGRPAIKGDKNVYTFTESGEQFLIINTISTAEWVKEGILKGVRVVTPFLLKTPITYGDKTYPAEDNETKFLELEFSKDPDSADDWGNMIYIKLSDMAPTYSAGEGIGIAGDGQISVTGVKTNITKTNADITIEGGPLADLAKQVYAGGVLPAGTNMQDFLMKMLCQEIYPTPVYHNPSFTSSIAAPSVSFQGTPKLVIPGTVITVNDITANAVSHEKSAWSADGFTHGYSLKNGEAASKVEGTYTGTFAGEPAIDPSLNKYKLEASINNGAELTGYTAAVENADVSQVKLTGLSFVATKGETTLTITETAPKYSVTANALAPVYYYSNLGNLAKQTEEKPKTPMVSTATNNGTCSVTGVYPVYTNIEGENIIDEATEQQPLKDTNEFIYDVPSEALSQKHFKFRYNGTIDTVEFWNTTANKYETFSNKNIANNVATLHGVPYNEMVTTGNFSGEIKLKIVLK